VTTLLAVPNVSEGRDRVTLDAIAAAFAAEDGVRVLDVHSDRDHHRSVFTLAGAPGTLAPALRRGARAVIARIDLTAHHGEHPRIGALDVAPVVHLDDGDRGRAAAEALVAADLLGELGLPVYLYGALAQGRTRAELRSNGGAALATTPPDFGPRARHPTAGAVLVAARPPLIAFNVDLQPPATLATARDVAARIREGGSEGLQGVRAIGLELSDQGIVQISTNVEDHEATSPARVVAAIQRHAPVARAELVALAPRAAFAGFPPGVPLHGLRTIEEALAAVDS